jgi:transposase
MEATGVYWMPLYDALQQAGLQVTLFNGAHARNLPGRKSDVQDCEWHAMLHSHGLLQPCFVTPESMRPLRTYSRRREELVGQAAESIQQMQRACDEMNVRLHQVISQLHGVSGLRVIDAILEGVRDPRALLALCDLRIRRRKEKEVLASLEGTWHEHHLFELQQARASYHFCQEQIAECDRQIAAALAKLNAACPPEPLADKAKPMRHNVPQVENLYGHLLRLAGGRDAQAAAGLSAHSWLKLTAELGPDLRHWKTEKHFTAWLGLAPAKAQSGRRCRRLRRRRTRVGQIFRECALSLAASKHCALGAFYRRLKAKRGTAVAIVAAARKLAVMYWQIMVKGVAYVEEGVAKYQARFQAQRERYLQKLATELGYTLARTPATA